MKIITYVTFILFAFNVFFVIGEFEEKFRPVTLTYLAIEPVYQLVNSKLYLEEKDSARSRDQLKNALTTIDKLKAGLDDGQSLELIETVLPELEHIYAQSNHQPLEISAMNDVYIKMLLGLSYLQVRHALNCLSTHQEADMHSSLKRAMLIVKKALLLSEGSKIEHEVMIYADMNNIVRSRIEEPHAVKQTLQRVLAEIESLEVAFHK